MDNSRRVLDQETDSENETIENAKCIENDQLEDSRPEVEMNIEETNERSLVYGITDNPPIHIMLIAALQQGLLALAGQLAVAIFVADAVCAANDEILKARILGSTLFMDGLTTVAMVILGARLPLFQGASPTYVIPLLLMSTVDGEFCDGSEKPRIINGTVDANYTEATRERALLNLRGLQGSLMLAGFIQAMIGFTGLVGILLRFVGPITVVTSMLLSGIYLVKPVTNFAEVHWGMAAMTVMIAIILFLYLGNKDMPIPVWTPSGGFRIIRYPLHQMFAILISMVVGWIVSGIMTYFGVFSDDPTAMDYNARTDSRIGVVHESPWFVFPYPGQFGSPLFSIPGFVSFIIATVLAILDSVGDYYACARVSRVPPPPGHAVNRGILIEGVCTFFNGVLGCGNGTNSYGGNVGAIGVTRVASRSVFVCTGVMYVIFGIIGKFSAVFISIPYPVLGGALIMVFGIFIGLVISNLQVVSLTSSRNLAVLGISIFAGLVIPNWFIKNPDGLETGSENANKLITMVLSNPNFAGTVIACILDNTVPGNAKARGIEAWHIKDDDVIEIDSALYDHTTEVYKPLLPRGVMTSSFLKYVPFLPNPAKKRKNNRIV